MENVRMHGDAPYGVAVVHGGPGAAGEMAPVARALARDRGVLEPLQTATSVEGQAAELEAVLRAHAALPVVLVGHSWGAWLSFLVAARDAALVRKLVLVSSGPFEAAYAGEIRETRMRRLDEAERAEFETLLERLHDSAALAHLATLVSKTDAFDPIDDDAEAVVEGDMFDRVWREADALRRSGGLLALGEHVRCPVVAIHGDHDPHPVAGVHEPLSRTLEEFRMIVLERCGHTPWRERRARGEFFRILQAELRDADVA